jgi:O-antigen/teichoic acid export membrane protein
MPVTKSVLKKEHMAIVSAAVVSSAKRLISSKRVKQTGVLYLSLVASLLLGILVSVINTRMLGAQAFGDFKFLQSIWAIGVTFVTFGVFATGGNLLAKCTSPEKEKSLIGSLLIIACFVALFFTLIMAVAVMPIGYLYGQELAEKIRLFLVLMFVFPMQLYLQETLRGINAINSLALLNSLPQFLYILAAVTANKYYDFSLDIAIFIYLSSIAATVCLITISARPRFKKIRNGISVVMNNNRSIGLNVYLAVLVTTVASQISQFSLAYFFDTRLVGVFSLAITITMPLTMIPNAIATTFFKQFASLNKIPNKVIAATLAISGITLICFVAIIKEVIVFLYSTEFIDTVRLAYVCAAGAIFHGVGDVYNRFLLSHGFTRVLRNNAIQLGLLSVIGYVFLVVKFDVIGAAITKLMVDVFYMAAMIESYYLNRKFIVESSMNIPVV